MGSKIASRPREVLTLLRYGVIGVFSVGVDFAVFAGLRLVGVPPVFAQGISYFSGTLLSFILNTWLNFRIFTFLLRRLVSFLLVALVNSLLSSWLLGVLLSVMTIEEALPKLIVTAPFLFCSTC